MSVLDSAPPTQGTSAQEPVRSYRFVRYRRVVLPLDGFVYWVRADLLGPSALVNDFGPDEVTLNQSSTVLPAHYFDAIGTIHWATNFEQAETFNSATSPIVFNSKTPVVQFNAVSPGSMYILTLDTAPWGGGLDQPRGFPMRVAFSQREWFFEGAGINHYVGTALQQDLQNFVIDDPAQLDTAAQIISNSLPAWLALNNHVPLAGGTGRTPFPVYPSFLVPNNLGTTPLGAVHIYETTAFSAAPYLASDYSHSQPCWDRVRITIYNAKNQGAMDFVDCVNQYSLDEDRIGIMNMPVVRDDKRPQVEFQVLGDKKSIEYEVSYTQFAMRQLTRQLLKEAIPSFIIKDI